MSQLILMLVLLPIVSDDAKLKLVRDEYSKALPLLKAALTQNVFIHEIRHHFEYKPISLAYGACGDFSYFVGDYEPGVVVKGGYFLTKNIEMRIGFNPESKKYKLNSYARYKPEAHRDLQKEMEPLGPKYLFSLPFTAATVFGILNNHGLTENHTPTQLVHLDEAVVEGEKRIRAFFRYSAVSLNDFDFGVAKAHGCIELAPERAWVITTAKMLDGNESLRVWTNQFDGTINGVPRLKKVVDERQPIDRTLPAKKIIVDVIKYEPLISIDPAIFTPEYYGLETPADANGPSNPPYLLFAVLGGAVLIAIGAFLLRTAGRRQVRVG